MILFNTSWYNFIQYIMIWFWASNLSVFQLLFLGGRINMMKYDTVWYDMIWYNVIWYDMM